MVVEVLRFDFHLYRDNWFLISAGTPQDQRKESEEHKESHNKSKSVTATRDASIYVLVVEKTLFFYSIKLFPLLLRNLALMIVPPGPITRLLRSGFQRTREPGGRRISGVPSRGTRWADDGRGVERIGGLLPIMGIPWRALHVVDCPVRRWRREARHLWISLTMHWHCYMIWSSADTNKSFCFVSVLDFGRNRVWKEAEEEDRSHQLTDSWEMNFNV